MKLLNCRDYIENFLKIRTKDGTIEPLIMNAPQLRLYNAIKEQWQKGKPVRIIILKARQMGFSTVTEAVIFFLTATGRNTESMIVAHKEEATSNLFRMSKRFYDELPPQIAPMQRASNAQELVFDTPARSSDKGAGLGSRIRCATAGGSGVGRSYTLRCLHLSELAFWPGNKSETYSGLAQAVPDRAGTMIIIESTANGYDEFKKMWDNAVKAQKEDTDGFIPIFFPWYEMAEYRRTPRPDFKRTEEEEKLAETFGLDDEQLAWRRWCIATTCAGNVDMFRQEYPSSPDEAFISTGRCVFDKDKLVLCRKRAESEKWERGTFKVEYAIDGKIASWKWEKRKDGIIRIRKHPQQGVPYVIGGDTAGTGSDNFVGQVLDNRNGEQVAILKHRLGERLFAEQMYCLGKYYNTALIGVEVNYSTYPEMVLEELGYDNLYVRERLDTYTGAMVKAYGFNTTASTRPVIIDGLKDVFQQSPELICDYETLGEMLTFIYDEHYRPQAEVGEHDDTVMALAIAHFIRPQQRYTVKAEASEAAEWSKSMWEDYNSASAAEKEYLLQKWGNPK